MNSLQQKTEKIFTTKQANLGMGGPEAIAKQQAQGKLTVRERLALLFDPGTFTEIGILAEPQGEDPTLVGKKVPADGVVCGHGLVNGRRVGVIAYDFTAVAGTIGEAGERKALRMREMALHHKIPLVWLLDSVGARVQEIASSRFAGTGKLFYDQVMLSGFVPQVAAMMGPCAAGTAYIAGLADFVPMVKGTSSMALAGPPLVKAAIGEEISAEDLGGSRVHCEISGVGDLEVSDDKECIEVVKKYLGFFPNYCGEKPPITIRSLSKDQQNLRLAQLMSGADADEDRLDDAILNILPDDPRKPYDMRRAIAMLIDEGSGLEIKPSFGQGLITTLARMGGYPLGIVASQPAYMGGVLKNDEADKAARFINLCDAFNIPLLFLQDVPGFMVGSQVEKQGIIRHGAKMLYAVSRASVPKITVIVRKAYGAGYYVMCGRDYAPDLIVAWPSAEISLMGAEGAVNILFRKEITGSPDPEKTREVLVNQFREKISLSMAAGGYWIDDVIDPRDTRKVILQTLQLTEKKKIFLPEKKHGVMPV